MASSSSNRRVLPTSPFKRPAEVVHTTDGFAEGDRVTLDSCGLGRVIKVSEDYVTVDFGSAGIRRVLPGTPGFSQL